MKTIKQMLITVAVLLCSATVHAYDFEVDGIYYNIVSLTDLTVEVTSGNKEYSGEVIIPSTVTYKTKVLAVTEIGSSAFSNCYDLISITIPEGVTSIGGGAFQYCSSLTAITIPESVTSIGSSAFRGCSSLTAITLPERVTSIGSHAFYNCSSLTTVNIPEGVTTIEYSAFYDCSNLTSITIPKSVTSIEFEAFYGCISLKELRLEDGEKNLYIESTSFDGSPINNIYLGRNLSFDNSKHQASPFRSKKITSLTIGYCITGIESDTFSGCSGKLLNIYLMCETPPSVGGNNFEDADYINTTVYVPQGTLTTYQEAEVWKNFWNIQEHEVPVAPDLEIKKCATPTISYEKGKLTFTSETEGAEFVTEITNSDITKHYGCTIELTVAYNVSTYAKRDGYANSDIATVTLCWIEGANGSDIMEIESAPVLIKAYDGTVIINGVMTDTEVAVYSTNGTKLGSVIADGGEVAITTSLGKGNTAIVHIGNKAVKVIMQ